MDYLVYEDKARYDAWVKAVVALPFGIILITAIFLYPREPEEALGMLFTAILVIIVYWIVMPRKFCIMSDNVKVVLGNPFSFRIPFRNIKEAREPKGHFTAGINFAPSSKTVVELIMKHGLRINISPYNRQLFLENLDKALNEWKREHEYDTTTRMAGK